MALVNIGHETTNTNILQGGMNVYARDIFVGGRQYATTIAQRFDLAPAEAEAIVRGEQGPVSWVDVEPVLDLVSQELGQEIQRTLDYFGTTAEHERIQRILLSGGCALMPGLQDFLAGQWGIEVIVANPFKRIEAAPGTDAGMVEKLAPLASVATGWRCAIRTTGSKGWRGRGSRGDQSQPAPTGSARRPTRARGAPSIGSRAGGSAGVITQALTGFFVADAAGYGRVGRTTSALEAPSAAYQTEITSLKAQNEELKGQLTELDQAQRAKAEIERRIEVIGKVAKSQGVPLACSTACSGRCLRGCGLPASR